MSINSSTTVIIRSVGERTESLCKKLILDQGVPKRNVLIIREAPFSAAMKKSFEIGINRGLRWTLCVDADVLLRENAISEMVRLGNKQSANILELQGLVLDKLTNSIRQGGPHLYRTSLLESALKFIPKEGTDIRPEASTLLAMEKLGFPWKQVHVLFGLHDFEQYNRDIFRKCFVHAHKHLNWLEKLVPCWKEKANDDDDYYVALTGLAYGIKYVDDVYIDVNQKVYSDSFAEAKIKEKDALDTSSYSAKEVENIIQEYTNTKKYSSSNIILVDNSLNIKRSFLKNVNAKIKDIGIILFFPWMIGWILRSLGATICNKLENN